MLPDENLEVTFWGYSIYPVIYCVVVGLIIFFAASSLGIGLFFVCLELHGKNSTNTDIHVLFYPKNDAPKKKIIEQLTKLPSDSVAALYKIRYKPSSCLFVEAYIQNQNINLKGQAARTMLIRNNHDNILLIVDDEGNEVGAVSCQCIIYVELLQ